MNYDNWRHNDGTADNEPPELPDYLTNEFTAFKASIDQFEATIIDLYIPTAVRIEKAVKERGGSKDLARETAALYVQSMFTMSGMYENMSEGEI